MNGDTNWDPVYAYESTPTLREDGSWQIDNVRNFSHIENKILTERWETHIIDPESVRRVWFYIAFFPEFGRFERFFGHSFLGFEFANNTQLSFSIEARRRKGEKYAAFTKGLTGAYKLTYLWGTLSDFQTKRTHYQKQRMDRYPLDLPQNTLVSILLEVLKDTQASCRAPQTYNTFSAQCTNKLLRTFSKTIAGMPSWHLYWYITGLTPKLLAKHDAIDLNAREIVS